MTSNNSLEEAQLVTKPRGRSQPLQATHLVLCLASRVPHCQASVVPLIPPYSSISPTLLNSLLNSL